MKTIKLAAPLFILRHECEQDLPGVLRKIRALGYDGVEFLGLFGCAPEDIRAVLDEIGLAALGDHVNIDEFYRDIPGVLAARKAIGCRYISVGGMGEDAMPGGADFPATREKYAAIAQAARAQGITLLYHNHANELEHKAGDIDQLDAILQGIPAEDLQFEPDLGWIAIGGGDPAYYLEKYRDRSPVLHLKDYYASDVSLLGNVQEFQPERGGEERGHFEFRPTGYGVMNYPALMDKCLACNPGWIVADHDLAYGRDNYQDLKISLDYLRNLLLIHQAQ